MVVSAILAVRINLPFARGAMWVRRWSGYNCYAHRIVEDFYE
jgi:hypothetical protein